MITPMSHINHAAQPKADLLRVLALTLILAVFCGGVYAQEKFANADKDAMYEHIMKAKKAAGSELAHHFYHRCFVDPDYEDSIAKLRKSTAPMEPLKVFDNLYFLGQNAVTSWALQTSEGFILFDTLNNPDEAKQFVEGGMAKLGLDPNKIKYIVLMHEHADHFGGAKYLKEKYGPHIMASSIAWEAMAVDTGRGAKLVPQHDMDVTDGQKFTLGDTTITFYLTPGHSNGTISAIFKTSDHGTPHVVGFFGGMGSPHTEANRNALIKSMKRWQPIAAAAGVDTLIANHQGQDYAVENLEFLKIRHANDPNPFVLGKDLYQRYFDVQEECTYAALARNGQKVGQ
jgi:metallo-beta-lactamase class B